MAVDQNGRTVGTIGGGCGYTVEALARVMRRELRKRGVKKRKVVYSKEPTMTPIDDMADQLPHALHLSSGNRA